MAITPRVLQFTYNVIRDRLGLIGQSNMGYQEATFFQDAEMVGTHIRSILISSGERHWDDLTSTMTISADAEKSNIIPYGGDSSGSRDEIGGIKRIWALDDDSQLLIPLINRRVGSTDVRASQYPQFEFIDNQCYWFPGNHEEFKIKLEYLRAYNSTANNDVWSTDNQTWNDAALETADTDEMGDKPDIPGYADDYFLNELTVRAALATGRDAQGWMNLAMRSRESMVLNAAREVPRRKHVMYRGL